MSTRHRGATDFIPPALATRVDSVPDGEEWLHEPKLDGYRIQCHVSAGASALLTRNGLDWGDKFPGIAAAVLQLAGHRTLILDGEIAAPAQGEISAFQALQGAIRAGKTAHVIYWVFDLLHYNGLDLRTLPLSDRRAALSTLLQSKRANGRIRMTQELRGAAHTLLSSACTNAEEGIISKRRDAPYRSGRSRDWLKIKCAQQDEFVVVGFTAPRGSRAHLGALALATNDDNNGNLRYVGRVGSGLGDELLRDLAATLTVRDSVPESLSIAHQHRSGVTWVEPQLLVSVIFAEWTSDGLLRHATFAGTREDKPLKEMQSEAVTSVRGVSVSHGERVVFRDIGLTKADLADYYVAVAPLLLPHLANRPLSLLRCPEGAEAHCFFQKHWPKTRGVSIPTRMVEEADGSSDPYAVVSTASDLVALVQMNVIEIHPWASRFPDVDKPDRLILDFDPGPGVLWDAICDAARSARDRLTKIGLRSWVKLSGGKGLHVVVPFSGKLSWEQLSLFSRLFATQMAADEPGLYTISMAKGARTKRIFIDWMRNSRGATAAAPWTVRARPGAPIAIPLSWTELADVSRGDLMTVPDVTAYLRSSPTDVWSDLLMIKQSLTSRMVAELGAVTK